jgi:hypothetical protein
VIVEAASSEESPEEGGGGGVRARTFQQVERDFRPVCPLRAIAIIVGRVSV